MGEYHVKPAASPTGTGSAARVIGREPENAVLGALADTIADVENDRFPARLAHLLELATGYESAAFICYFQAGGALLLFSNLSRDEERRTLDPYFDGAYLLDPWYNMIVDGVADGVYRLCECAPDDFVCSDYYRQYYANVGLEDEYALFVRLSDVASVVLSSGTRQGRQRLPDGFVALSALLGCIRSLCVKHWGHLTPNHGPPPARSISSAFRMA